MLQRVCGLGIRQIFLDANWPSYWPEGAYSVYFTNSRLAAANSANGEIECVRNTSTMSCEYQSVICITRTLYYLTTDRITEPKIWIWSAVRTPDGMAVVCDVSATARKARVFLYNGQYRYFCAAPLVVFYTMQASRCCNPAIGRPKSLVELTLDVCRKAAKWQKEKDIDDETASKKGSEREINDRF